MFSASIHVSDISKSTSKDGDAGAQSIKNDGLEDVVC